MLDCRRSLQLSLPVPVPAMSTLTSFSLRPCISSKTGLDRSRFMSRVQQAVEESDLLEGKFRTGHAMISIVESRRHFWSPWMHLEYRQPSGDLPASESSQIDVPEEDNVVARFSPHPSIWTGFMMTYLSLVVLLFFSLVLGYSQQLAQQAPWGYYLIPLWLLVAVALWAASQVGQRLAINEMRQMITVIENCLAEPQLDPPGDQSLRYASPG